jgi:hypothetical protein
METPYRAIPETPLAPTPGAVLARLVDGIGFRYRWATEGLRAEDEDFQPGEGSMSLRKLLQHILVLAGLVDSYLGGEKPAMPPTEKGVEELRRATFVRIESARARLGAMSDAELASRRVTHPRTGAEYPFWNMINGPMCDALTHVGQINAWRRLSGNPTPKANLFAGEPPTE